jgi:Transglycosylase-like domain/LysM domain
VGRPLTWLSGGILAGIFLVLSALVIHSPSPSLPSASGFVAVTEPAPVVPAQHHAAPRTDQYTRPAVRLDLDQSTTYTARRGDTLSSIARAWLGHADRWPALWYANRRHVRDPDALKVGTQLTLAVPGHPVHAWLAAKAMAAIPKPPAPRPAPPAQLASTQVGSSQPSSSEPAASVAATGSVTPGSAYEACVIDHESSGDAGAVNPSSGAGGLYGFLPSTWQSLGYSGLPEDAPVAEQQQAFDRLHAEAGSSPWMTDGC